MRSCHNLKKIVLNLQKSDQLNFTEVIMNIQKLQLEEISLHSRILATNPNFVKELIQLSSPTLKRFNILDQNYTSFIDLSPVYNTL